MAETAEISMEHIVEGLGVGLGKLDHTLSTAYQDAVSSARADARFKEVLLACALADPGEHGWFQPADRRHPYSGIIGEKVDIPWFNPQLVRLRATEARSWTAREKSGNGVTDSATT
jgi:hypothetical protein